MTMVDRPQTDAVPAPNRSRQVAASVSLSHGELARLLGTTTASLDEGSSATRVDEFATIIAALVGWCGSTRVAIAWFRDRKLPAFGERTPASLLREGRGSEILALLKSSGSLG